MDDPTHINSKCVSLARLRKRDPTLLLTTSTHNVIVAIVDLFHAGNKLLLSDVMSAHSSLTRCLNGVVNKQCGKTTGKDGEILINHSNVIEMFLK